MKSRESYMQAIASALGISREDVSLYYKGRVALYALLKAAGVKEGDEIILPAFTCVVVPNAIIYCGAKPVYVDIDPVTYNMDVKKAEAAVTKNTKLIIAQNTFGLSPDFDGIFAIARKNNLLVFEDCTHGFGGYYKGRKNGTLADATFFSTQWNKPFSTGIGGFSVVINKQLRERLPAVNSALVAPGFIAQLQLRLLLFARKHFLKPFFYWPLLRMYRWLSKYKLLPGSSSGEEIEGTQIPGDYFMGMGRVQVSEGIREIEKTVGINRLRKNTAIAYNSFFGSIGCSRCCIEVSDDHIFLKYPLLVNNREEFLKLAEQDRVPLGEWFCSPLHPVTGGFEKWQYHWGKNPVAERISSQIVNLPTDIEAGELEKVLDFLRMYKDFIA